MCYATGRVHVSPEVSPLPDSTLNHAIGLVQNVQWICFAVVFVTIYLQDRSNRSLRWFAAVFVTGSIGAVLNLSEGILPSWLAHGVAAEAPILSFGCLQVALIEFIGQGRRSRWITPGLVALSLPWFLAWTASRQHAPTETLLGAMLAIQTGANVWLLARSRDRETLWPRRLLSCILAAFCFVQCLRVASYIDPSDFAGELGGQIDVATGLVSVALLSVLPMAFIWMLNRRLNTRMQRESLSDPLTGVFNRRGLEVIGHRELARYRRHGHGFAVILVDIDFFKTLNDTYGHAGGDEVLSATAVLLHQMLRESDTAGRIGGEEFVLLLTNTEPAAAEHTAERIRQAIERAVFPVNGQSAQITASFGISHSRGRTELTWERLVQEADIAMYIAKRDGRNCLRVFEDSTSPVQSRSGVSPYSIRTSS